ncbi:hypothetical protein IJM86_06115 [bacterium]|nr:hypothetical protein [bacterium]
MSLIANLMNRLKRDCFNNRWTVESTRSDRGIEYNNNKWNVRDTVAVNKEFLDTLRNKFSLTINTYEMVAIIDRLLQINGVFTDTQIRSELSGNDLTAYASTTAI